MHGAPTEKKKMNKALVAKVASTDESDFWLDESDKYSDEIIDLTDDDDDDDSIDARGDKHNSDVARKKEDTTESDEYVENAATDDTTTWDSSEAEDHKADDTEGATQESDNDMSENIDSEPQLKTENENMPGGDYVDESSESKPTEKSLSEDDDDDKTISHPESDDDDETSGSFWHMIPFSLSSLFRFFAPIFLSVPEKSVSHNISSGSHIVVRENELLHNSSDDDDDRPFGKTEQSESTDEPFEYNDGEDDDDDQPKSVAPVKQIESMSPQKKANTVFDDEEIDNDDDTSNEQNYPSAQNEWPEYSDDSAVLGNWGQAYDSKDEWNNDEDWLSQAEPVKSTTNAIANTATTSNIHAIDASPAQPLVSSAASVSATASHQQIVNSTPIKNNIVSIVPAIAAAVPAVAAQSAVNIKTEAANSADPKPIVSKSRSLISSASTFRSSGEGRTDSVKLPHEQPIVTKNINVAPVAAETPIISSKEHALKTIQSSTTPILAAIAQPAVVDKIENIPLAHPKPAVTGTLTKSASTTASYKPEIPISKQPIVTESTTNKGIISSKSTHATLSSIVPQQTTQSRSGVVAAAATVSNPLAPAYPTASLAPKTLPNHTDDAPAAFEKHEETVKKVTKDDDGNARQTAAKPTLNEIHHSSKSRA